MQCNSNIVFVVVGIGWTAIRFIYRFWISKQRANCAVWWSISIDTLDSQNKSSLRKMEIPNVDIDAAAVATMLHSKTNKYDLYAIVKVWF